MCIITLNEDEKGGRRPENGREGREAAMEGRAATVRGAPADVLGDGRERDRRLGRFAARAREGEGRGGSYIWLCRAMDQGASVSRQDRWRGSPCHVTGQRLVVTTLPISSRHHAWRGIGVLPRHGNRRGQKC